MRRTLNIDKLDDRKSIPMDLLKKGLLAIAQEMRCRADLDMDDTSPAYAHMHKVNHALLTDIIQLAEGVKVNPW